MPTVNIYTSQELPLTNSKKEAIKEFIAQKLSGESRVLKPGEISLRIIPLSATSEMIGDLEIEVTAHSYPERSQNSDKIATDIATFMQQQTDYKKVRAWLNLVDLGHTDVEY